MARPTVEVISLGGTIAMSGAERGGASPQLTADDLIAAVPGLQEHVRLNARSFRQLPGAHLHEDDLIDLAADIRASLRAGITGVVVTQGTDTIEETAFILDLLVDDGPVVVTGAMRTPDQPGADGPANLRSAVLTASDPASRGLGTLVVLNDEIHAARLVRKTDTFRSDAFMSAAGPLGWVAEGQPHHLLRPVSQPQVPMDSLGGHQPVALVTITVGDDGRLLRHCPELGYRGVVIEGFGVGHVPDKVATAVDGLATQFPVVLASRAGQGPTFQRTYGFLGSERDLLSRGMIGAGHLDGPKARVLLSLLLRAGLSYSGVRDFFQRHFAAPPQPRTQT